MTTAVLACPSCRSALASTPATATCPNCQIVIPIVDGFAMWNERFIDPQIAENRGTEIRNGHERYLSLLERKFDRHLYEPYAWFRPFNESTRSLEPFRDLLVAAVKPGVPILDTWCRTGWTGELLASWFPNNPVVSLWEGDHDHLGYQGFRHWLPSDERAQNLTIMFANPNDPLPFADEYFGLIHGLDTLHRFPHSPLIGECLRVATADAPIMFPHVHLTNSEPDPFFERGCTQLHGTEWGSFLDRLCEGTERQPWVLSERDLYLLDEPQPLVDDRATHHYNGFIAIGPRSWHQRELTKPRPSVDPDAFLFTNPLLSSDSATGRAWIDRTALSGTVGHMADRHPVAVEALAPLTSRRLTSFECQVLAHCATALTVGEIAHRLDISADTLIERCSQLLAVKALQIESVSPAMAHLQSHYRSLQPERRRNFAGLWQSLAPRYQQREVLRGADGSSFDADDVDSLVQATRHWFAANGLTPGDRLGIIADHHVEYAVIVWAAWLSGLVVVPMSPEAPESLLEQAISTAHIAALAYDHANRLRADELHGDRPCIIFDPPEEPTSNDEYFADLVGPYIDRQALPAVESAAEDLAAIVFTSGSSGIPKAVQLTIGSLLHTGSVMSDLLQLRNEDRLLSLAPTHTVSGLRNPLVAALVAGTTVVVDAECADSALAIAEACRRYDISVLAASPVFIDRLASLADRVRPQSLRSLRTIATTADRVDRESAAAVAELFGVQVLDYYGLTETGGIVVAVAGECQGALGKPLGAAVEVHLDGQRAQPGKTGEIRVSGPSVMAGYLGETTGVRFERGWIYTGDLGMAHDDGSISLLGRIDQQIKRRSGEIYPHLAVVAALRSRPDVVDATVEVDPANRQIEIHVTTTNELDEDEVRRWLAGKCGVVGLPDRVTIRTQIRDDI